MLPLLAAVSPAAMNMTTDTGRVPAVSSSGSRPRGRIARLCINYICFMGPPNCFLQQPYPSHSHQQASGVGAVSRACPVKPEGPSWLAWVWAEWRSRSTQAGSARQQASVGL